MTDVLNPHAYHAHVYRAASGPELRDLHAKARAELKNVTVGRLHDEPIGPHTRAMFQIALAPDQLEHVLPWLLGHRGDCPVLIHPVHGDEYREHSQDALWLGSPLMLDLEIFRST